MVLPIVSDNYIVKSFAFLPTPAGIPFHLQGQPIPDPLQRHTAAPERSVFTHDYKTSNELVLGRFLGTVWPQQNQPKFLGANERVAFEAQW